MLLEQDFKASRQLLFKISNPGLSLTHYYLDRRKDWVTVIIFFKFCIVVDKLLLDCNMCKIKNKSVQVKVHKHNEAQREIAELRQRLLEPLLN